MNGASALIKGQDSGDSQEVPWEGRVTGYYLPMAASGYYLPMAASGYHLPMATSGCSPFLPVCICSGLYRSSVQTVQLNDNLTWDLSTPGCTEAMYSQ